VTLAEAQARFHALATGAAAPEAADGLLVDLPGLPARDGARVYAEMYAARLEDALRSDFPALAAALGEAAFAAVTSAYVAAFPSEDPDLGRLGRALSAFLAREPARAPRADAADLAALEWARAESFLAADVPPVRVDALAAAGARLAGARLAFVPALRVVACGRDPTDVFARALAGETPPAPAPPRRVRIAVWRRGFEVVHAALEDDEAIALEAAREGARLGEVCAAFAGREDAAGAAARALRSWVDEGWIAGIEVEGERPPPRGSA
jgi:hypothetical protein